VSQSSDTEDPRLVQGVIWQLLTLVERLDDNFADHAARCGLSGATARVLLRLQPSEAVPMGVLAERLRSDPSNLTGLVDRLEERGAIERRPSPRDRRVKALALTEQGRRLRERLWQQLTTDPGPLANLAADELRQLQELLSRALRPSP
jgi:DNA-binding MarR family transcriptional regulator